MAASGCPTCGKFFHNRIGDNCPTVTDQPAAVQYVCDRCGQPAKPAQPDTDPDAAKWYHVHVADDVFCGVVMHAADRRPVL